MGSNRARLAALLVATVLVIVAVATLGSQQALGSGTFVEVADGAVFVRHAGAEAAASVGQVLGPGDEIRTDDGARAVVVFFDGSTMTLEAATTVRVDATRSDAGGVLIALSQLGGTTWNALYRNFDARSRYEVHTPTLVALVRGTAFAVIVSPEGDSVVTEEGRVEVEAQGVTVIVTAGQQTSARPGQAPSPPAPAPRPERLLRISLVGGRGALVDPSGRSVGVLANGAVRSTITGSRVERGSDGSLVLIIPDPRRDLIVVGATGTASYSVTDAAGITIASGEVATLASGPVSSALPALAPSLAEPTASPAAIPLATLTPLPSVTALPTLSPLASPTALPTVSPLVSLSPLPSVTALPTLAPLPSPTPLPSASPLASLTPLPSVQPAPSLTPLPSISPTPVATSLPSPLPSPTPLPTLPPLPSATAVPSLTPLPTLQAPASATPGPTPTPSATPTPTPTPSPPTPSPPPVSLSPLPSLTPLPTPCVPSLVPLVICSP